MMENQNDAAGYRWINCVTPIAKFYFPFIKTNLRIPMNESDTTAIRSLGDSANGRDFPCARTAADFCIDSADRANWLVRRIIAARAYGDRVRTWAAKEERRAKRDEQRLLYLFGRQLEAWVSEELASSGGKRKSIQLPAGVVGFRRFGPKLVIDDHAAVVDWARQHLPEAIITKEHLSKSVINTHFAQTGEIPDTGARVEPEHDQFCIR
jgi:hypothetical protein